MTARKAPRTQARWHTVAVVLLLAVGVTLSCSLFLWVQWFDQEKLQGEFRLPMGAAERHDPPQRRFVRVGVESGATRRDAPDRLDIGHLEAQQRRPGIGQHPQVREVPVGHAAVDRRVLAHRRHHDAVLEREAAQLNGLKQRTRHE